MNDEEKLNVFREYLDRIKSVGIRGFTEFAIVRFPNYFWTLPASTTNENHGNGETLLDHVMGCLYMAGQVCEEQFEKHWTRREKDQLYSAIMLHDGWKCGEPGNECRITMEIIRERDLNIGLFGKLKADRQHAEIGYKQLDKLVDQYNKNVDLDKKLYPTDGEIILNAVRYHYGPWTQESYFNLSWPYDSVVVQCHNIDYHQTFNNMYITRHKKRGE